MDQTQAQSTPPLARAPLTPRRRLLAALRGEPADRVPGWLMRQAGRYLPQYQEVRRRYDFLALCKAPEAAAEVSIQPLAAIGSDAVIIFNDILVPLELAGAEIAFDDRGPRIHNPVRAPEDLKRLAVRAATAEEPVARSIAEVRRRVGDEVPILGFIGAPWTLATYWVEGRVGRQFESIGALRFRDPALLDALLELITPLAAQYLKIQIEAGADAVQIFDTWGSILGQGEYERFSARYIRRVIEAVAPLGAPVIVYVGGCAPYLQTLGTLGADALSVDWRVELGAARRSAERGVRSAESGAQISAERGGRSAEGGENNTDYEHEHENKRAMTPRKRLAVQGNLDPLALLAGPEAAARAVRELFEKFPPAPGHVFNLGHGVLPATPPEAARAVMEAVKRYGAY